MVFSFDASTCKNSDLITCIDEYLESKKCDKSATNNKAKNNSTRLIRYYYERDSIEFMMKEFSESDPDYYRRYVVQLKDKNSSDFKYFVVPDKIELVKKGKRKDACQSWDKCETSLINVQCSDIQRKDVVILNDDEHRLIVKAVKQIYFEGIDFQKIANENEGWYVDGVVAPKLIEKRNQLKMLVNIHMGYNNDVQSIYSHPYFKLFEDSKNTLMIHVENQMMSPPYLVTFKRDAINFSY